MADDPYRYFRVEARELADHLVQGVLDLEKTPPSPERVSTLLRHAHTLKGAARVVKQAEIGDLAHAIEDALAPFRNGAQEVPRNQIDDLLQILDTIDAKLEILGRPAGSQSGGGSPPAGEESLQTVRADVAEMDVLLDGMTEVHVKLASMRRGTGTLERVRHLAELLDAQLASPRSQREVGAKTRATAEEMRRLVARAERTLARDVDQIDREMRQLSNVAERLRLLPASAVFRPLERTARDAANTVGTRVIFRGSGGDVRLDAHVLEVVQRALVQLVRNAVAHGIESEAEREAARKPPDGQVTVDVQRRGNWFAFTCRDDGRGIDLAAVRRAALRQGIAVPDGKGSDPGDLVRILLEGGISTSREVTGLAGRGIGLDVVREAASRLGGRIDLRTEAGVGTTVEILVPVSLASLDTLVVDARGQAIAIPLDAIRGTLRIDPRSVARTADGASITFEGAAVPYFPLASAFGRLVSAEEVSNPSTAVAIESQGSLVAAGVDRLIGTRNALLRTLPDLTPADSVVAGVSFDAAGNLQLVLAPDALAAAARRFGAVPSPPATRPDPILVIDDSLTTRILEQSILESAGYQVELATSAEEALVKARSRHYLLFLVDVEMPGLDGFGFVEAIRSDTTLRDVPTILVTSRDAAEDLRRGDEVGASAYVTKGEFDQGTLLAHIRRLVGQP